MAEYTQNFNLIKPGQEEFYNVETFNNNADIIDAELKNLENIIEDLNADGITLPDGKTISEKFTEITTKIGNTEELDTETKLSLVAAINEINQALAAHKADHVRIELSESAPSNPGTNTWWYEDLGETADLVGGDGGLLLGNASTEEGDDVWFDEV